MDKELSQIQFEFSNGEPRKEFLSGKALESKPEKKKSTRGRRSLKENEADLEAIEIPADDILFQKQYYSIGEVALMFKVNTSLLRYWESEFEFDLRKNKKGDRFFKPSDIKNLELIYDLLRRRKFTIEGAKDYLRKNKLADQKFAMIQSLQKVKSLLLEIKANL